LKAYASSFQILYALQKDRKFRYSWRGQLFPASSNKKTGRAQLVFTASSILPAATQLFVFYTCKCKDIRAQLPTIDYNVLISAIRSLKVLPHS